MKKIFMFVPAFGNTLQAATFLATHALAKELSSRGIATGVSSLSFPDIAELRSMAFTIWHDTMPDVDYLLFIDADMAFKPELVLDMILHDEPLVGTIYRQRNEAISWAGSGTGGGTTQRRGNFMLVEGVGMGCTLIRRDLAQIMMAKMPHVEDRRIDLHPAGKLLRQQGCNRLLRVFEKLDLPDRGVVSEDLSFCLRWAQCGGQTWAAIGYDISHVGNYDYRGNYLEYVEKASKEADIQKAAEPDKHAPILSKVSAAAHGNGHDPDSILVLNPNTGESHFVSRVA